MPRITIEDLKGLIYAIDCMGASTEGTDNKDFHKQYEQADNCRFWVLAEIERRERAIQYRKTLKLAKSLVAENTTRK